MNFETIRKHWIMSLTILLDVIIVIILIVLGLKKASQTATLNLKLAPSKAVMIIDGKQYQTGIHKITPGNYKITVTAEGFDTKTLDIELKANEITKFYDYLMPKEDNLNYYASNTVDYEALKAVGNDETAKEMIKILSIKEILPIKWTHIAGREQFIFMEIKENPDCNQLLCLTVLNDNTPGHEASTKKLVEKGYNPDDYKITYEN